MSLLDPESIIKSGGLLFIAFMVFAECGLLIGFVFPGDTLLFAAGFLASQGQLNITELVVVIIISAILGGQAGYVIGQRLGPKLFTKKDGLFFRREYVQKSEKFYEEHGGKTIALARFIPIIRTFAPVVAGVGKMNSKKFMLYNIIGAAAWGGSVTLAGYYLGSLFPGLADKIELIFIFAVPFIFGPPIYHLAKDPQTRIKIKEKFRKM